MYLVVMYQMGHVDSSLSVLLVQLELDRCLNGLRTPDSFEDNICKEGKLHLINTISNNGMIR